MALISGNTQYRYTQQLLKTQLAIEYDNVQSLGEKHSCRETMIKAIDLTSGFEVKEYRRSPTDDHIPS